MKTKTKIVALAVMSFSLSGCFLSDIVKECDHQWGPWETLEEPTCTRKGKKAHVCELCGEEREKSIAIDREAHKWTKDRKSDVEATCTSKGIKDSKVCSYCGEVQEGTETDMIDHTWQYLDPQPEGFREATCSQEGIYFQKCSECGADSGPITEAKVDHDYEYGEKTGVVTPVSCKDCDLVAYNFAIEDAGGWNKVQRMNSIVSPDNMSKWNIDVGQVPAGFYDVMLSAKMVQKIDGSKKFYNLSKAVLAVDDEMAASDRATNELSAEKDTNDNDDFRYTIKVDDVEYTPQQTATWEELGLEGEDVHSSQYRFVRFVDGVTINADTKVLSLCHNRIPTSLICKEIRLVKHVHDGTKKQYRGGNGQVDYELESCSCGYRKITINAKDGTFGEGMSSKDGTPDGYIKLKTNNDFITYEFKAPENIVGDIYMVGRQDTYPNNKSQKPYNCSWYLNEEKINFKNPDLTSGQIFGEEADPNMANYSKEGAAIVGEVTLRKDDNVSIKYVRNGSYNLALSQVVIEGRAVNHIHKYERNAAFDSAASCTLPGKEAYVCDCGDIQYKDSDAPIGHNYKDGKAVIITSPTCTTEGEMTIECTRCSEKTPTNITIPVTHSMQSIPTGGEAYELTRCAVCGETNADWELNADMIQDLISGSYSPSSTVVCKSGTMSNGKNMNVFKFDQASRKVDLSFYNEGDAKEVTFRMLATAKSSDVANCKMYNANGTDNRFDINVKYGGNDHAVTFDSSRANKTLEDLGVSRNKISNVMDGNVKLADAAWIDYCTFTIGAGRNTITFSVADDTAAPVFIGAFALTYRS